jgi:predicted RNase H-like nuclease (RuvC/YqgF family)
MTQRLHHVNSGLIETATLLEDPDSIVPQDWHKLQSGIKDNYTMESERAMFEQIVAGTSLKEALSSFKQSKDNESTSQTEDDVELF